jgi:hypothetical protein
MQEEAALAALQQMVWYNAEPHRKTRRLSSRSSQSRDDTAYRLNDFKNIQCFGLSSQHDGTTQYIDVRWPGAVHGPFLQPYLYPGRKVGLEGAKWHSNESETNVSANAFTPLSIVTRITDTTGSKRRARQHTV